MDVALFDFDLPEENIALRPANPRDSARFLVVRPDNVSQSIQDYSVSDLPEFLRPGDALVFNDTKVIPAQLEGKRLREGAQETSVSATLHLRKSDNLWHAFARPGKRIKSGDLLVFASADGKTKLEAHVDEKRDGGEVALSFNARGGALDEAIMQVGHVPLPPYIASKRAEDQQDQSDYQTIYARENGAVAAPTAGLHFTPQLLSAIKKAGVEQHFVTLHVGAGTFLPVKADNTDDHKMHFERGYVTSETAEALNAVKARGGRIISVGTTSLRLLESATNESGKIEPWQGETGIFITPGYRFRVVDILMTNFHLPKSTLFMLVSAFCGLETMRSAYEHAIKTGYRFYSYGDSSLLFRKD